MAFESISMVYVLIAAMLLSFGAIIYRGRVELIGGYDPNKVTDKEGLGRWVGSNLIFGGLYFTPPQLALFQTSETVM